MRLIDADALSVFDTDRWGEIVCADEIRHAPTIDAVEVVRCAVCNKWKPQGYEDGYGWCLHHQSETRADDYCSYGERKESE